jgi:hypothetical protein
MLPTVSLSTVSRLLLQGSLNDAHDRNMRAGGEIISPQRIQHVLIAGEGLHHLQLLVVLGKGIFGEHAAHLVEHAGLGFFERNGGQRR